MKHVAVHSLGLAAFLGLLVGLTAALARPANDGAASAKPADHAQIDRWIAQLGDTDFDVREAAMRNLNGCAEAVPTLRKAARSGDTEVRKRAAEI